MPRAGQVKPRVQERLSDRITIGVLTATFPPALVDQVVAETGRTEQRHRLLPARVVVYLVLALALFSGQAYEEVARPLATEQTAGARYRGLRVLAIDGTTLDVPDTAANATAFGRPATHRGERTAFPQVRLLALAECGTHAIIAAVLGPYSSSETTLAPSLFGRLDAGVLLLADRGFIGFDLWRAAAATDAQLVWRAKTNQVLPVDRQLADGSYLSRIYAARDQHAKRDPVVVRVVEYTLGKDPGRHQQPGPYRLLTTILDPEKAPAVELAALYHQRWEFETALDELKTHQRGPGVVLRSRSPELVSQEIWGMLLVHHAIRALMHQAATDGQVDPDRLSFTRSLRVIRRQAASGRAALSP